MEECVNYPHISAEDVNISPNSVGPDWGGYCQIFGKTNCEGLIRNIEFPGNCMHLEPFQSIRCLKGDAPKG